MNNEFKSFNPFEEAEKEITNDSVDSFDKEKIAETEKIDTQNLEQAEGEFAAIEEDLLDLGDEEDTMWMIQKISIGILKIALATGIIVLILWSIWGGESNKKIVPKSEKVIEKSVEKNTNSKKKEAKEKTVTKNLAKLDSEKGFFEKIFGGGGTEKEEKKISDDNRIIPAVIVKELSEDQVQKNSVKYESENPAKKVSKLHTSGVQIMAWNYWLETNRLLGQKNTPGYIMLWTKDAESLFDIPFANQVKGKNDTERKKNVENLIINVEGLLSQAENLQNKSLQEIAEFSQKAEIYEQESIEYEGLFLNALNNSDPSGIDKYLAEKISAEKKQTANGIEAESRIILSEKIDSYAQVMVRLREYLIANKNALVKDVQVVNFPDDPFNRIIPLQEWESSQTKN